MGKYEVTDGNDMDYRKLIFLKAIANELAEANRLKRLELKHIIGKDNNVRFDTKFEELEDNA